MLGTFPIFFEDSLTVGADELAGLDVRVALPAIPAVGRSMCPKRQTTRRHGAHPLESNMSDLHIIATLTGKEEKASELKGLLLAATEKFRREPGCLAYTLLEDQKQAGRFVTVEKWVDADALEAHMSSPAMQSLKPLLADLLAGPMAQDFFDALLEL
jgi:quinol monooxygenase YgiN